MNRSGTAFLYLINFFVVRFSSAHLSEKISFTRRNKDYSQRNDHDYLCPTECCTGDLFSVHARDIVVCKQNIYLGRFRFAYRTSTTQLKRTSRTDPRVLSRNLKNAQDRRVLHSKQRQLFWVSRRTRESRYCGTTLLRSTGLVPARLGLEQRFLRSKGPASQRSFRR